MSRRRKVKVRNTPPDNAILQADIKSKEQDIKPLQAIQQKIVENLTATQRLLTGKEKVFCSMRSSKATSPNSLESHIFKILIGIGVEQSIYHGGSLNGKDIKKVMNNGTYLFDEFSTLLKAGKREDC